MAAKKKFALLPTGSVPLDGGTKGDLKTVERGIPLPWKAAQELWTNRGRIMNSKYTPKSGQSEHQDFRRP